MYYRMQGRKEQERAEEGEWAGGYRAAGGWASWAKTVVNACLVAGRGAANAVSCTRPARLIAVYEV